MVFGELSSPDQKVPFLRGRYVRGREGLGLEVIEAKEVKKLEVSAKWRHRIKNLSRQVPKTPRKTWGLYLKLWVSGVDGLVRVGVDLQVGAMVVGVAAVRVEAVGRHELDYL